MVQQKTTQSAINLTELMISMGLVAVLLALALGSLKLFQNASRSSAKLVNQRSTEETLIKLISQDLDEAVRIQSSSNFAGVRNPDPFDPNPNASHRIEMILSDYSRLNSRVQNVSRVSPEALEVEIDLTDAEQNAGTRFMSSAVRAYDSFIFKAAGWSHYFPANPASLHIEDQTASLELNVTSDLRTSELPEGSLMIAAKTITYELQNQDLIRKLRVSDQYVKEQVVARGLDRIQFFYDFRSERNGMQLLTPQTEVSHINDPTYMDLLTTQPDAVPVSWNDLRSIRAELYFEDGESRTHRFYPLQFNNSLQQAGPSGIDQSLCPSPEDGFASRCRPECSQLFTSGSLGTAPTPNQSDWIGYGAHVESPQPSDYCVCGTDQNGEFVPPESTNWDSATSVGGWQNYSNFERQRLLACGRHFGCQSPARNKTDPLYLACACFTDASDYISLSPSNSQIWSIDLDAIEANFPNLLDDPSSDEPTDETALKCNHPNACDARARNYFGVDNFRAYKDTCACRTHRLDSSGAITDTDRPELAVDWSAICNLEAQMNGGDLKCQNTFDTVNNAYLIKGDLRPEGLSIEQASVCECLKNTYSSPDQIPNSSRYFDFRKPTEQSTAYQDLPDGLWPDSFDPTTNYGSPESIGEISLQALTQDGSTVSQIEVSSCNQALCDPNRGFPALSCCTAEDSSSGAVLDQFADWSGYCHRRCNSAWNGEEITRIRQFITGTTELPESCGGPSDDDEGDSYSGY